MWTVRLIRDMRLTLFIPILHYLSSLFLLLWYTLWPILMSPHFLVTPQGGRVSSGCNLVPSQIYTVGKMYCFFFTLFLVFVSQGCITSHINPAEFVGAILRLNVIYLTYLRAFFKTTDLCVSTRLQSSLCLIHNLLCHDDAVTFI